MKPIPGHSAIREFEYLVANYCGARYCLSVCNASVGILGTFYALGLQNAEVITTPLTWPGAITGLQWLKCNIRFCDVEPQTLTLNPALLESIITPKTKAVFSADFLGYPARLDEIKSICRKYNILLIHDAAGSFGSKYQQSYSGYYADVSIVSFGSKKIFSLGEGGCVLTEHETIYQSLANSLLHPNRQGLESFSINPFALNTSMNPLAASLGIKRLKKAAGTIQKRKRMVKKWLLKNDLIDLPASSEPNFYKILLSKSSARSPLYQWEALPYNHLIYNEPSFQSYQAVFDLCPVAENALINQKIIIPPYD